MELEMTNRPKMQIIRQIQKADGEWVIHAILRKNGGKKLFMLTINFNRHLAQALVFDTQWNNLIYSINDIEDDPWAQNDVTMEMLRDKMFAFIELAF